MAKAAKKPEAAKERDKPANGKGEAAAALDAYGIDKVCEEISNRKSLTAIAKGIGVSIGSLLVWIEADAERSARAREVRRATARLWDEQAERVVKNAPDEFALKKAKELAHHYRWRASKIAPADYGDSVTLKGDAKNPIALTRVTQRSDDELMAIAAGEAHG